MKTLFIFLLTALGFTVNAQVTQQWMSRYNGPAGSIDSARNIVLDNEGNVYITGSSTSSNLMDYTTLKYSSTGSLLWEARYDGPSHSVDDAQWITIDNAGNVYVTGWSRSGATSGTSDFLTVKYNSNGVQQWEARYNGPANSTDKAVKVVVDASGNVYVTGWSNGNGTSIDYATVKYNNAGIEQWVARYNGPGNAYDSPASIVVDNSGNVFITGWSQSSTVIGSEDYLTVKYSSNGTEQWIVRHNGPANYSDIATAMAIDNFGNIYVTGYCYSSSTMSDFVTIKYNTSGLQQWISSYNGPLNGSDLAKLITIDNSGNVIISGYSAGVGTSIDYATVKYNSAGAEQWSARYNGIANDIDEPHSITTDYSGNVYVAGKERVFGAISDYSTVKYDANGVEQWVKKFNGEGNLNDGASSVTVDISGNVFVTGTCITSPSTSTDMATLKYSQNSTKYVSGLTGNNNISSQLPESYNLMQNYPNPFNPATTIVFSVPEISFVQLRVFDIIGNELAILVNSQLSAGIYRINWSAAAGKNDLPSGVYFYSINAVKDNQVVYSNTKKMILTK